MQDENGAEVVDELEQEELPEGEQEAEQKTEGEEEQQAEGEEEVVITLGDEPPPADEFDGLEPTPAIRQLREAYKEKSKRLRELEKQVAAQQQAKPEPALVLPTKPTLEACDYDADKFEAELESWHDKKRAVDEAKRKADEQAEAARREWQAKLDAYAKAKAATKIAGFDEAEEVVRSTLSELQQSVILSGADNPAYVVAYIGTNTAKAKELAAIADPVKFAFAVAKLEDKLKSTTRSGTATPPPEKVLRGSVPGAVAVDNRLDKLREKARVTGDWSDYFAAKARKDGK